MTERLRIEHRPANDPEIRVLVDAAVAELRRRYPGFTGEHPLDPRAEFLVALSGAEAAGCVGMFPAGEDANGPIAEMKRLFVREGYRGQGVARALIDDLERRAVDAGFTQMRLETGDRQPEAIKLYQSAGYRSVPPFDSPYDLTKGSRFFNKRLRPDSAGRR